MTSKQPYYRNKKTITVDLETVDPGSLWKLEHSNTLVLVDDDRFVSHKLTDDFE